MGGSQKVQFLKIRHEFNSGIEKANELEGRLPCKLAIINQYRVHNKVDSTFVASGWNV